MTSHLPLKLARVETLHQIFLFRDLLRDCTIIIFLIPSFDFPSGERFFFNLLYNDDLPPWKYKCPFNDYPLSYSLMLVE